MREAERLRLLPAAAVDWPVPGVTPRVLGCDIAALVLSGFVVIAKPV